VFIHECGAIANTTVHVKNQALVLTIALYSRAFLPLSVLELGRSIV
jgi:hypothetical protein